ncbi:hypothetical protein H2O64_18490 [Kordia sp. YSTF-M3]|uniref:Uncharacterized protein n=1 Tax=Kordia aestuariivivens TaxID=2759037 RepID=A0ABR7QE14_9FLAO|nr:hypothetical protein [Kordia aestuariivivens]MBC8756668.1 hypothetical protein [Kordia aestuariivivens]
MKEQNSQTLFRFTSLRSPDLSEEKNKELRFIFPSEAAKSDDFYDAMSEREPGVSKWQTLQTVAADYRSLTKSEVKAIDSKLFEFSEWLAKNRTTATIEEIEAMTISVSALTEDGTLWNNLFYQFVTEEDFYTKEAVIHMLKANHVIANFPTGEELDADEKKGIVNSIVYAKVILPSELFDHSEDVLADENNSENTTSTYKTVPLSQNLLASIANLELQNLEKVTEEVEELHATYEEEYRTAYATAKANHDKDVKVLLDAYEVAVQAAKDTWCDLRGDIVYDASNVNPCDQPVPVKYPSLPVFSFSFDDEIDSAEAINLFSPLAYETLSFLKPIDKIKTFAQAKKLLAKETAQFTATLYENTSFYKKSVSINGTILPISKTITDDLGSAYQAAFCSKVIIDPKTGNSSWKFFADIASNADSISPVISTTTRVLSMDGVELTQSDSFAIIASGSDSVKINFLVLAGPVSSSTLHLKSAVTFLDGTSVSFDGILRPNTCGLGTSGGSTTNPTTGEEKFVPSGYGMRQLGIADYRKVEQSVHCYTEGEVSHIENVMAREYKEKSTRRLRSSENTTSTSSETEKERLSDTTTTDRFEMQNEVSQVISESQDFSSYANSNASWKTGGIGVNFNIGAGVNFATHTSNEDSVNQAMTEAQEITSRAMDRVVQRVKEERISKIVEEYEENNSHGFDNRKGDKHIVGVYRWIDKIYKNQIFNYGRRLMYEFAIPQPSKLHRIAMTSMQEDTSSDTMILAEPIDPRTVTISSHKISDASKIDEENYKILAAIYNAEVSQPPVEEMFIGKAFSYKATEVKDNEHERYGEHVELDIPEGYYTLNAKAEWIDSEDSGYGRTHIIVGGVKMPQDDTRSLSKFVSTIPVSFSSLTHLSGNSNVSIKLRRLDETFERWQLETFNAIITAYEDKLAEYLAQKGEEEVKVAALKESNPLFYRQIEQTVLRKNCLSYLMDQSPLAERTFGKKMYSGDELDNHNVTVTQSLDDYASFAKFMEQAFEWEIMSYNFYPFYWGNRKEWNELYNFENNDPLFRSFMQAGLARVVLTVRPGFEEAVMHYMSTGSIWNGGELPLLDDPLYMSIVDELKKPLGIKEGKAWKTRVPTSLTILQADSLGLKVEKALPCECDDIDDFIESDQSECSSNIVNDPTVFNDLQVGDAAVSKKEIQLTFHNNSGAKLQTVADFDDSEAFPLTYKCMDQEIVIQRDANWDLLDSAGIIYQVLAKKISLISGVEAQQVFDNEANPLGLQFKIDYGKISTFSYEKPNVEGPVNDQAHDVLKVEMNSEGIVVSSPTKYTNRIQDKYATSLTDAEIDVLLPLNRFQ